MTKRLLSLKEEHAHQPELRDVIIDSWTRCQNAGIDRLHTPFRKVDDLDLRRRIGGNRPLIDAATPYLQMVASGMAGISHVVYLVDAEGIVLSAVASDPQVARSGALSAGYDWSEAAMGTNGAGTAIAANRPVAIVRHEHYSCALDGWTCTAAPIHGPDGSVIGAIDASTNADGDSPERLLLVVMAARAIEQDHAKRSALVERDKAARQDFSRSALLRDKSHSEAGDLGTKIGTKELKTAFQLPRSKVRSSDEFATSLSPSQLRCLNERIKLARFAKGQIICDGQQAENSVYFISSGIGKLICLNKDGDPVLLELLTPGDVFTIPSLLPELRDTIQCKALTECRVGMVRTDELLGSVMGLPLAPFRAALRLTTGRWWQLLLRHSCFLAKSLEERIILVLLDLASKFGVQDDRGSILNAPLTHGDIAELTGGSRPRVSMCLGQLVAQGALVRQGRRMVIVMDKLLPALPVAQNSPKWLGRSHEARMRKH